MDIFSAQAPSRRPTELLCRPARGRHARGLRPVPAGRRVPRLSARRGDDRQARAQDDSHQLRVRGADHRLEGSRGPRARDRHPRTQAFPGRRAGESGSGPVRDRPEAAGGANRRARSGSRPRAGAEGASRPGARTVTSRSPNGAQSARKKPTTPHPTPNSRTRASRRRRRGLRKYSSISAIRASPRRSTGSPAAPRNPKAASSTPTRRC